MAGDLLAKPEREVDSQNEIVTCFSSHRGHVSLTLVIEIATSGHLKLALSYLKLLFSDPICCAPI